MSVRGLSNLVVTIMAAGGVEALPAHDQRHLHRALTALDSDDDREIDRLWARFGGRRSSKPDPAVGRRIEGVTPALWEAVDQGLLSAVEYADGSGAYVLSRDVATAARQRLMHLPAAEAAAVHRAAVAWASTDRKKRARAALSF